MQLNSSKPVVGLVATLFLFWLIYVILASDPLARLNRMCSPIIWGGRGVSSLVGLFKESDAAPVAGSFDRMFHGCRLWGWNVFYARAWAKMEREQSAHATVAPAVPYVAPSASGVAAPPAHPAAVATPSAPAPARS